MTTRLSVTQCPICCSGNRAKLALRLNDTTRHISTLCDQRFLAVNVESQTKNCDGTVTYVINYDETLLTDPGTPLEQHEFELVCVDAGDEWAVFTSCEKIVGDLSDTLVDNEDGTYTHTAINTVVQDINTRLQLLDKSDGTVDLTLPDGITVLSTVDVCSIVAANCPPPAETLTSIVDNGDSTFTYTDEDSGATIVDTGLLVDIGSACETVGAQYMVKAAAYDSATRTLTIESAPEVCVSAEAEGYTDTTPIDLSTTGVKYGAVHGPFTFSNPFTCRPAAARIVHSHNASWGGPGGTGINIVAGFEEDFNSGGFIAKQQGSQITASQAGTWNRSLQMQEESSSFVTIPIGGSITIASRQRFEVVSGETSAEVFPMNGFIKVEYFPLSVNGCP